MWLALSGRSAAGPWLAVMQRGQPTAVVCWPLTSPLNFLQGCDNSGRNNVVGLLLLVAAAAIGRQHNRRQFVGP